MAKDMAGILWVVRLTCQETLTTLIEPPISKTPAKKRILINHNTLQGTWATQLQVTELLLSSRKDPGQWWPKQPANWIFTPIASFMPCEVQAPNYKTKKTSWTDCQDWCWILWHFTNLDFKKCFTNVKICTDVWKPLRGIFHTLLSEVVNTSQAIRLGGLLRVSMR